MWGFFYVALFSHEKIIHEIESYRACLFFFVGVVMEGSPFFFTIFHEKKNNKFI